MNKLLLLGALALPLTARPFLPGSAAPSTQEDEDTLIDRLDFLEGRWVAEEGDQYIEETWSPPREDALVGCLRWARKGNVWLYELMSIETDEEHGLVFRLRHFERGLKPWAAEKDGPLTYPLLDVGDGYAIFENPERDSPRRFVYRRSGDELSMRVEGVEEDDVNAFRFRLDG